MIGAGPNEPLKKLPFTIPELVAASPCKSSDGILYTGKKVSDSREIKSHLISGCKSVNPWYMRAAKNITAKESRWGQAITETLVAFAKSPTLATGGHLVCG